MPISNPALFRFPPGDSRLTLIGATGTGKTTAAGWFFAHARLDRRPWLIIDFKREELFDWVGFPPIRALPMGQMPPKERGVYLISPNPGQEDILEDMLWKIWRRGNIGLFIDEAALMPDRDAWRGILQQGRSKHIPVIACTQRPVDVKRAVFSEASYFGVWRLQDERDAKVIRGFVPGWDNKPLPQHYWSWYDVARNNLLTMKPVPDKTAVADMIRQSIHASAPKRFTPFSGFFRPIHPAS